MATEMELDDECFEVSLQIENIMRPLRKLSQRFRADLANPNDNLELFTRRSFAPGPYLIPSDSDRPPVNMTAQTARRQFRLMKRGNDLDGRLEAIEAEIDSFNMCSDTIGPVPSSDGQIRVGDKFLNMREYLESSQFLQYIETLTRPDVPVKPCAGLVTEAKEWQLRGKERLKIMAQGDFKGGFLADPMGFGKSLTALMAALEIQEEMKPDCGFILIVCRLSCIMQWRREIMTHWNEDSRPSYIILDKPDCDIAQLLQHRIVICSSSFLRARYMDVVRQKDFAIACASKGLEQARQAMAMRPAHMLRPHMPLHSDLYNVPWNHISVLLLDEAQDYRNPESLLNAAARSLKYRVAFLLTGTPIYKSLEDLPGQLRLLPGGGPFFNIQHFLEHFCGGAARPSLQMVEHRNMLLRLLSGTLIARPKELLGLPELVTTRVLVDMSECEWELMEIKYHVRRAMILLFANSSMHDDQDTNNNGYAHLTKAQQLAGSVLVYNGYMAIGKDAPTHEQTYDEALASFLFRFGLPEDTTVDEFTKREREAFEKSYGVARKRKFRALEESDAEESDNAVALTGQQLFRSSRERVQLEGFEPARAAGEPEVEDQGDAADNSQRTRMRASVVFTQEWLSYLTEQPDKDVFSPRIQKICEIIHGIRVKSPNEKILVVSSSVMMLDVTRVALERKMEADDALTVNIVEFNGTMSMYERDERAVAFNDDEQGPNVMLLSASVGGAGLNLARASHLIICEPFWTPGDRAQVIGRAHRLGQTRKLHVYDLIANCRIDEVILRSLERKDAVVQALNAAMIRDDQYDYLIPELEYA